MLMGYSCLGLFGSDAFAGGVGQVMGLGYANKLEWTMAKP